MEREIPMVTEAICREDRAGRWQQGHQWGGGVWGIFVFGREEGAGGSSMAEACCINDKGISRREGRLGRSVGSKGVGGRRHRWYRGGHQQFWALLMGASAVIGDRGINAREGGVDSLGFY